LKASNININSTRKISDHKIYALKVERVPNTFENLNSFEMTLKMLKTMQIYQKCIFLGFHCFFAIFGFFLKNYQNMGQKLGSNKDEDTNSLLKTRRRTDVLHARTRRRQHCPRATTRATLSMRRLHPIVCN
jgi:hypothetical protein